MSPELEEQLVEQFPELCIGYQGDTRKTCMAWGFEVGDGWFEILKDALTELEEFRQSLPSKIQGEFCLTQVKEKFGGLRIYLSYYDEKAGAIVARAAQRANRTCELCGTRRWVKLRGASWYQTLCKNCWDLKSGNY